MRVKIFVHLLYFSVTKSAIKLADNHERYTHKAVDQLLAGLDTQVQARYKVRLQLSDYCFF